MFKLIFPQHFFLYLLLAIAVSLFLAPIVIFIANRIGLIDVPGRSPHKLHADPTPLAGGTVLILGLAILLSIFALWKDAFIGVLVLSTAVIYLFGLLDDLRGLSALPKLVGQIVAGVLLISSGVSVHFVESIRLPFLSATVVGWLDAGLTLFWLIGITNAMNMIDSMDGLATGLSGITFMFFLPATLASNQDSLTALSVIMLGLCIGVYFNNITPARLFLGDSGAQALGFMVAAIAMAYAPPGLQPTASWFVPILLLAIPIFDTTLVTVSRLRRRLPVYKANRDHTYHRLVGVGLSPLRAVMLIHLAAILIDCLAFVALTLAPLKANFIFGAILLTGVAAMIWLERKLSAGPLPSDKPLQGEM